MNKAKKNNLVKTRKGFTPVESGKAGTSRGYSTGFTIIELVVVCIIIAVLASIAFVSYESSRKQARDARRVADMVNIESSLRMYYLRLGSFPATGNLDDLKDEGYFQKLPQTPAATPADYDYCRDTATPPLFSILHTTLEDSNNMPSTDYSGAICTGTTWACDASTDFCLKVAP